EERLLFTQICRCQPSGAQLLDLWAAGPAIDGLLAVGARAGDCFGTSFAGFGDRVAYRSAASAMVMREAQIGAAIAPLGTGDAINRDIVRLGDPYRARFGGAVRSDRRPTDAILR